MSKAEIVNDYRERSIHDLGQWAEDPRAMLAVAAKTERIRETLAHMDRPLPTEASASPMEPGIEYSMR